MNLPQEAAPLRHHSPLAAYPESDLGQALKLVDAANSPSSWESAVDQLIAAVRNHVFAGSS